MSKIDELYLRDLQRFFDRLPPSAREKATFRGFEAWAAGYKSAQRSAREAKRGKAKKRGKR